MANIHEQLYDTDRKLQRELDKIKQDPISENKKKAIFKFVDNCFAEGLSKSRVLRYLFDLRRIAVWLPKDFEEATTEDIKALVNKIENSKKQNDKSGYASATKYGFRVTIKKFYKWLKNTEGIYPPEVRWMKNTHKIDRIKLPEDMLTENDVKRLIDITTETRNKAFVSMLYESGCRIGELMGIKLKNIKFDQYGAQLFVDGKTGFRRVRTIISVPYLQEWINKHPRKDDPEAFLWVSKDGTSVGYARMKRILEVLGKRAGIKKKVNPHNFRHSRATYLANHLTEAQMKEHFGWTQSSRMASVYVHLSGRDVDNALLKVYGMKNNEEKEESELKPKTCQRCEQINPATNKFCSRCGAILDLKLEELINKEKEFLKLITPDIIEKLIEKKVQEMLKKENQKE